MIPVETAPGIGVGDERAMERMNSSIIYLIHCKNLGNYSNVPYPP
jgi:hypothetical protein